MHTNQTVLALSLVTIAIASGGCGDESCRDSVDDDGNVASICGCEDSVDENGESVAYCTSNAQVGTSREAFAIACGVGRGMMVNTDSCVCYIVAPIGLYEVATGDDCFNQYLIAG